MKKLVVISHTEHQLTSAGIVVGWGPTVREISSLAKYWEEIIHVACLEETLSKGSSVAYTEPNIRLAPIPKFGGPRLTEKLGILFKIPKILKTIHSELKDATEVQLRLPMGIGLFVLIYLWIHKKRRYRLWIKYATNWGVPSKSLSYRLQQNMLVRNNLNCFVTINGIWPNQPRHCISFMNPCLSEQQFVQGQKVINNKVKENQITLIFVGRIDASKGIDLLIEALSQLNKEAIAKFHIVGEGSLLNSLRLALISSGIAHEIHGFLSQEEIYKLFSTSHFLILPSRSEGFPKVVAEALNYGCLPIVSAVGSIPHYIHHNVNGFILEKLNAGSLVSSINQNLYIDQLSFKQMIQSAGKMAESFTFEHYYKSLQNHILNATQAAN